MESPPTSRLCFLDSSGGPIEVPLEWTDAQIALLIPSEEWSNASLKLQHRELPIRLTKVAGKIVVVAEWPKSNPGNYLLDLAWSGGTERRVVTVATKKVTENACRQMLFDLEIAFPTVVAIALQRLGAFTGIELLPPNKSTLAQEVIRLQRAIEGTASRAGLVAALADMSERPHQILGVHEPLVKANQARRPHPVRIKDAICRGYNIGRDRRPIAVHDTRVETSFDVYENRLVRLFLHRVQQRLAIIRRAVGNTTSNEELSGTLKCLSERLERARRRARFLGEVSLLVELPARTTMVFLNIPAYRAAMQGYFEFSKSYSVRVDDPRLDAPLENMPTLYQLWGTMAVIRVVLECAATAGFRVRKHTLLRRVADGFWFRYLPDGEPAVVLAHPTSKAVVRLIPERTYRASGSLRSISFQQRPDIAVEIESSEGQTKILLFDPKYKLQSEEADPASGEGEEGQAVGTPKKADIDKMHAYRDAIRSGDLRRAVSYAAILYPGAEVRYADDIEALRAYPGDIDALTSRLAEVVSAALFEASR